MKKILIAAGFATLLFAACKKDEDDAGSFLQPVSRPTITLSGGEFYSINTGGDLPQVTGTAYDSFLNEPYPVSIVGTDALDNTTPGLYIVSATSKNKFGFVSNKNVYVAVTDISESSHLEGRYLRTDVSTGGISNVTRLARGLYQLDNLGGVARTSANATLIFPVLFVQANDSLLLIPEQADIAVADENQVPDQAILRARTGDTTYRYAITSGSPFGNAVRTFKKQ